MASTCDENMKIQLVYIELRKRGKRTDEKKSRNLI
jgi:hypothetical protein